MITHPILTAVASQGVRLGLQRMGVFLEMLGDPHRNYPVIHVAGTNGKGSTVRLISEMLQAAGLTVGELTSPHLQQVNERIKINGTPVTDDQLNGLLDRIVDVRAAFAREAAEAGLLEAEGELLTFFEVMTAAGFVHLSNQSVDVAVVEVGLGGRLDATNLVAPVVSVITNVAMDHVDVLGPDIGCIAAEKAGIIKRGTPVIVGNLQPAALRVVRAIARELDAPTAIWAEDYRAAVDRSGGFRWAGDGLSLDGIELRMAGEHQMENAAAAIAAVRQFKPDIPESALRAGLSNARHDGRLEWLADDVLIDCAHNEDGATRLAHYLAALPRDARRTLLLGMSSDKEVRPVVIALAPHVDRVLATHCAHPRAMSAGDLAARIMSVDVPVLPAGPIESALAMARGAGDQVVVAGSVFLAGAVRDLVGAR